MGFFEGSGACPDAGGEHGDGEAGAFFVGPVCDGDGVVGCEVVVVEDAEKFDAGADAEDAVLRLRRLGDWRGGKGEKYVATACGLRV